MFSYIFFEDYSSLVDASASLDTPAEFSNSVKRGVGGTKAVEFW